jgi:hypothetical protein
MVYGAGWVEGGEGWKCVACSFYDMRVTVWDWVDGDEYRIECEEKHGIE